MNSLYTFLAGFLLIIGNPNPKDHFKKEVKSSLEQSKQTTNQTFTTIHQFEKIADKYPNEWLGHYYASYYLAIHAFAKGDEPSTDSILDVAEFYMLKSDSILPENSEISCLKSMIASARIIVDPNNRGYKYGQLSSKYIQDALLQDPLNPRSYYLYAQGLMYMPEEYGGGCKAAQPILKKADELFSTFSLESEIHPSWGQEENSELIENCASKL